MSYGKEIYVTYGFNSATKEFMIDQAFECKEDAQWFCDQQNSREKELINSHWAWYYTPKTFFSMEDMNRGII